MSQAKPKFGHVCERTNDGNGPKVKSELEKTRNLKGQEKMETREQFAKIVVFAHIDKYERGKSGRKITMVPAALSGGQLESMDRLADGEKEVLLQIVPSSRGTLFAGKEFEDLDSRVTAEMGTCEQDAIGILILAAATKMRERMLQQYSDGVRGWDNPEEQEDFLQGAKVKLNEGDLLDGIIYAIMAWNLEKPPAGASTAETEETEDDQEKAGLSDEAAEMKVETTVEEDIAQKSGAEV